MSTANVTQTGQASTVTVTVSRGLPGIPGIPGIPGTTDYNELDNVPESFTPSLHASTHATGGTDPITPASIGAATQADIDAATSDATALTLVKRGANGEAEFGDSSFENEFSGNGLESYSFSGNGLYGESATGVGVRGDGGLGIGGFFVGQTLHAVFGISGTSPGSSYIDSNGAYGWNRAPFGATLNAPAVTATRAWTLPDASGTLETQAGAAAQIEAIATPSYLDRFTLRADATDIVNGTTPEIGNPYFLHLTPTSTGNPPRIAATGGLVGKPGVPLAEGLFYLGGRVVEGIRSFGIDLTYSSVPGGTDARRGVTMAFSLAPLFTELGAIQLPADMLHIKLNNQGISKFGIGNGGASFSPIEKIRPTNPGNLTPWTASQTTGGGIVFAKRFHVIFEFAPGECRIKAFNQTHIYRDARIVVPLDWWYESAGAHTDSREYPTLYAAWANAPYMDSATVSSTFLGEIGTSGPLVFPHSSVSFNGITVNGAFLAGTNMRFTPFAGWAPKPVVANLATKITNDLLSGAGDDYTTDTLLAMEGRALALGSVNTYEITGFFGNTDNDRRIAISEEFSGDIFDSGVLAAADVKNRLWVMRITVQRTGSNSKRFMTHLAIHGGPNIIRTDTASSAAASNLNFRTTSVAAGDVSIYTYFARTEAYAP